MPANNLKHGLSGTSLYNAWYEIRARCFRKSHKAYKWYGARGITLYPAWKDFECFMQGVISEIGPRPTLKHSLDRKDNNGNYAPGNLRWATQKEQMNNTRANRVLKIGDQVKTMTQWSELSGVEVRTVHYRLKLGWSPQDAVFTKPFRGRNQYSK